MAECTDDLGFWFALGRFAISDHNIYGLFVSTHYPSDVTADGGGPVYYQQQVLARLAHVSGLHGPSDIADRAGARSNQNGRCSARWAVPGSRGSPQHGGQCDSPPPRNPAPGGDSYRGLMRTAAFLRNVPILACLPDESLERLAGQVNDVLIGLMDWKALPHVVDPGRRAARDALEASPEPLSRLGS